MADYAGAFAAGAGAVQSGIRTGMELAKLAEERAFKKDYERRSKEMQAQRDAAKSVASVAGAKLEEMQKHAVAGTPLPDGTKVTPQMLAAAEDEASSQYLETFQRRLDLGMSWVMDPNPLVKADGQAFVQQVMAESQMVFSLAERRNQRAQEYQIHAEELAQRKTEAEARAGEHGEEMGLKREELGLKEREMEQTAALESRRIGVMEEDVRLRRGTPEEQAAAKAEAKAKTVEMGVAEAQARRKAFEESMPQFLEESEVKKFRGYSEALDANEKLLAEADEATKPEISARIERLRARRASLVEDALKEVDEDLRFGSAWDRFVELAEGFSKVALGSGTAPVAGGF